MSVHHPELGLVPLYGGPTDLYSIPQPLTDGVPDKPHEQELFSYRFSLESNSWVSTKRVGLRIVQEEVLAEVLASREGEAAGGSADRAERPRHG